MQFIGGMVIGAIVTLFTMALITAGKDDDE